MGWFDDFIVDPIVETVGITVDIIDPFDIVSDIFEDPEVIPPEEIKPESPLFPVVSPPSYSQKTYDNVTNTLDVIPFAVGKVKIRGVQLASFAHAPDNTRIYVYAFCEGEINNYDTVYINDIDWDDIQQENLIVNPNFDSDVVGWVAQRCGGEHGVTPVCDLALSPGGQSGNCMTMVIYPDQATRKSAFACQAMKTIAGDSYNASSYVKNYGAGETGQLEWLDAEIQAVNAIDSTSSVGFWSQLSGTFTASGNITVIRLRKLEKTEARIQWDTVDVRWASEIRTKTEYLGSATQNPDARWLATYPTYSQAARGLAYVVLTLDSDNKQISVNPNVVAVVNAKEIAPIAGGANAFTRNPAVILWHIYTQIEGRSTGELNQVQFQALETYCDAVPASGTLPRYRFDHVFDTTTAINDMKKLVYQSFRGNCIWSQGKIKPVWERDKTSTFNFTQDNIVANSLSWEEPSRPNVVRINYINSASGYKKDNIEEQDETSVAANREILYEENALYITDEEIAGRRCRAFYKKFKYVDYTCRFVGFPESSEVEVFDVVTVTHTLPGWTSKKFMVKSKNQDEHGRCMFECEAYQKAFHNDETIEFQPDQSSDLPDPYESPDHVSGLTLVEDAYIDRDGRYVPTITITYTRPTSLVFWNHARISVRVDRPGEIVGTLSHYGDDYTKGTGYTVDSSRAGFTVADTVYVLVQSVNDNGVAAPVAAAPIDSVEIDALVVTPSIVKGLRIENKTTDYTWDGGSVTIVWRGGSATGGAGRESAGQESSGAGGVTIDPNWRDDEVEVFTDGALRHTVYTRERKYTYIYGDGQDDFLDSFVIAAGGTITFKVFRWNIFNVRSVVPAVITISNQNPATPIGLSSVGFLSGAEFSWTSADETDWSHYSVRTGVEGAASSAWKTIYDTYFPYYMSSLEYITYGTTATIHFDTKAVDLYNNESSIQSTSVAASGITTVQITKNSISAPKILANTITATEIAARSITGDRLAVSAVTADVIAASSVTASHIYGAGFGNLTISAGTIQLNSGATIGLSGTTVEIQDGADLKIQGGGDIILQTSTTDPGLIQWTTTGSGVSFSFGSSSTGNRGLRLWPEIADLERIYFGRDLADNLLPFYSFSVDSWNSVFLRSMKGSGSTTGIITIDNNNAGCTTSFRITNNNKGGTQRLELAPKGGLMTGHFLPKVDSSYTLGNTTLCWSNVFADAGITACSGRKYKTNIRPETLGLDFINALQPVEFEWNKAEGKTHTGKFRGIIAQDVEAVLDEVGYKDIFAGVVKGKEDDGSDWYGFRYEQLLAPIVKAIQDLEEKKANK